MWTQFSSLLDSKSSKLDLSIATNERWGWFQPAKFPLNIYMYTGSEFEFRP